MVPLIDMFFLVLTFFIFGVFSMTMQQGLLVDLPNAQTAVTTKERTLTVTVTADGNLALDRQPVTLETLRGALVSAKGAGDEPLILINADRAVDHGVVMGVLDAVRQAGLVRVSLQAEAVSQ